jgi:transposase InsO family protein
LARTNTGCGTLPPCKACSAVCLDREWFHTPQEARVLIEQYRRQYNEVRPHSSLGYHTPAEVGTRRAPIASGLPPEHGREALLAVT